MAEVPTRHNLPPHTQRFFGRHDQVTGIKSRLGEWRVVTVTGHAGIGKTSLALRVAYEVLDDFESVSFVAAYGGASPDSLAGLIHVPGGIGTMSGIAKAAAALGESKVLIVLDACENADAACKTFCSDILSRCPRVRVLDIGRAKLGVDDEVVFDLGGMDTPPMGTSSVRDLLEYDSARLFVDHYCADPCETEFSEATVQSVAYICNMLKGFPLAIEVAAAHAKNVGLEEVADLFREGLPEDEVRGISELVGETIRWSCFTLSERSRSALRSLSVFEGGFDSYAASAVCDLSPAEMRESLDELMEARLLVAGWNVGADFRYQLPQAVAEYARGSAVSVDEMHCAAQRHAEHFLEFVRDAKSSLHRAEQSAWFRRCRDDHGNIIAALEYYFSQRGELERTIEFFSSIGDVWIRTGPLDIACEYAKRIANCEKDGGKCVRLARALNMVGAIFLTTGKLDDATKALDAAVVRAEKEDDLIGRSLALSNLAVIYRQHGEYEKALVLIEEHVALLRSQNDSRRLATALLNYGSLLEDLNRNVEAVSALSEATTILEQLEDEWTLAWARIILSELALNSGRLPTAAANTVKCLSTAVELGDQRLTRLSLDVLAIVAASQGQLEIAATFLGGGDSLVDKHGVPRSERLRERLGDLRETVRRELGALKSQSLYKGSHSLTAEDLLRMAQQVLVKC